MEKKRVIGTMTTSSKLKSRALLRPTHCRKWQPSVTLLSCTPLITFLMSVIKSLKAGHVTCFRFPTTSLHFIHYLVWAIVGFFVFLRMIERSVVNTGTFSTLKTAFPGAPLPHITSKCFHVHGSFFTKRNVRDPSAVQEKQMLGNLVMFQ